MMDERRELARLIDPYSQGAPCNEGGEAADRILAAGWRKLPQPGTEEWEAMVERAGSYMRDACAWGTFDDIADAALRAALCLDQKGDDDGRA